MALMDTSASDDPSAGDAAFDAAVGTGKLSALFSLLEKENRLPAGFLARTAQIESGGRANAKNPNSSAGGLFQFIDSTAQKYGLTDKFDPVQSTLAAAGLATDNADYLRDRLGREPTGAELYLAHQQGAAGAAKLLSNPNAPAASLVGGAAARLNGGGGLTGGQMAQLWTNKFDGTQGANPADIPAEGASEAGMQTGKSGFNVPGGSGMMNQPYQPADQGFDIGNVFGALGQALLSGTRQNPFGTLPAIMARQQALADKREDRRYGMYKDNRDFGFRQQESERTQGNADRSYGLQERGQANSEENSKFTRDLQQKQFDLSKEKQDAPDDYQLPDGSIRRVDSEGNVKILSPGIKSADEADTASGRANLAERFGLKRGTPEYGTYVLTGKLPGSQELSVSDRNAIRTADDQVASNQNVISNMQQAKELSKKAYGGPTAGVRGAVTGFFGNEAGQSTTDLDNLVTGTALGQLKSIFGGNPTEGERAILLQIQGSSSQPDAIRQKIYDRAIELAQQRLEMNKQRASELRGGTYYKPPGEGGPTTPGGPRAQSQPQQTKPDAGARFKALTGGGMSKEDAYAKMQSEGY